MSIVKINCLSYHQVREDEAEYELPNSHTHALTYSHTHTQTQWRKTNELKVLDETTTSPKTGAQFLTERGKLAGY